jgi:3'(2'), 5'-bisphosphate nucleotidase
VSRDVELAGELARDAGTLLLQLRATSGLEGKPLGAAGDRRSNELLLARLGAERPADAILSEESVDDPVRLDSDRVWILDPLDGTREYAMAGRDDWAVHVALWQRGLGVAVAAVAQPALGAIYTTDDPRIERGSGEAGLRLLVSDSRPPAWIDGVVAQLGAGAHRMGSAGAKAMAVVRGEYDAYVHDGGQWEWDSAAPVGVAAAQGLHVSRADGSALVYNEPHPYLPDLVICRPEIAAALLSAIATAREQVSHSGSR